MGGQTGFLMAKAGEVSNHEVCHSLTPFSEIEFIPFLSSGRTKSMGWLCTGKKDRSLGLAWEWCSCSAGLGATSPGSQSTLRWEHSGKPVQKNY